MKPYTTNLKGVDIAVGQDTEAKLNQELKISLKYKGHRNVITIYLGNHVDEFLKEIGE